MWINCLLVRSIDDGLLNIPAPILSRVFQEMEKGMVEYQSVLQVMTVPFPFPYAQVTVIMIWVYLLFTPVVMVSWASTPLMAFWFTFMTSGTLLGLEMIAAELENPFGDDINDLPCMEFQEEMNEHLIMLRQPAALTPFELGPQMTSTKLVKRCKHRDTWAGFDDHIKKNNLEMVDLFDERIAESADFADLTITSKRGKAK